MFTTSSGFRNGGDGAADGSQSYARGVAGEIPVAATAISWITATTLVLSRGTQRKRCKQRLSEAIEMTLMSEGLFISLGT